VSRGLLEGDLWGEPVASVYATAEDSWSRTLRPRLEAAGADLELVHFVGIGDYEGGLSIPGDVDQLASAMESVGARLLVLDPLNAHLHSAIDTYRDSAVRQALAPLATRMDVIGAVAIEVMHWSKARRADALDRVIGSRGFTAATRSALAVGELPDGDGTRVLVLFKSNLGRLDVPALRYRIEGRQVLDASGQIVDTSGIAWLGEAPGVTAGDLFAAPMDAGERSDRAEVMEIVIDQLRDGPESRTQLDSAIRESGLEVSSKTVQRALRDLGVNRKRHGYGGGFLLSLPDQFILDNVDTA
jgi:hypothetical protein